MPETPDRGAPKAYTVLGKSFHDGRLYRGGETIMLYDDEVGPHHQEIVPRESELLQVAAEIPKPTDWPILKKRARAAKLPATVEAAAEAPKRARKAKPAA